MKSPQTRNVDIMSKMNEKRDFDKSTFALSKDTFGHASDCFVVFPSVEMHVLPKNTLLHVNLIMQKYANLVDNHNN